MPSLARITVFPIKSLDGHELSECQVLSSGALAGDRRYALVDGWGKFVNGKSCSAIHKIRASFSDELQNVTLSSGGQQETFDLATEQEALAAWCSVVLGKKCRLIENSDVGFPDDCDSPGPTVVSTATLETVANWFEGLDLPEVRRRFRFNLEFSEAPAFWEDGLVPEEYTKEHKVLRFRLGDLIWQGHGVCQRCVVPTRDSSNGKVTAGFARNFTQRREETLPNWAPAERFDHFYRLGVNTRLDSEDHGNVLRVGDSIELIS